MNIYSFKLFSRALLIGATVIGLSGCFYEPYPGPPPPAAPVAVAPAPYYGCCYTYPEYPAYYGPDIGVGLSFGRGGWGGGRGGWGGHGWR